jgi:hypothetical protein
MLRFQIHSVPSAQESNSISFTEHIITTNADDAKSVRAADLDSDGDIDVLCASNADDKIAWYENDAGSPPAFTEHIIATTANGPRSVSVADVDDDGDLDVLSASAYDDKIAWWENSGGSSPAFIGHIIATNANYVQWVTAADVDGDKDLDVLSASEWDDKIAWYENNGSSPPAFISHVITTNADGALAVDTADMDGDGDLDVLSSSWVDDKIAWYENNGASPPAFTSHVITASADGSYTVHAADINGDGAPDVLSAAHDIDTISWYENNGSSPPAFTGHVITTTVDGAVAVYAADIDNDGDLDVLSASRNDNTLAWYENDGGSPPTFISHVITTNAKGAYSIYAADVDGDGDTDILSASDQDDKIAWWEQEGHPITTLEAVVDIHPNTLNLKSKGKWAAAYIELPDGYNVADIDVSTVLLESTIPAELSLTEVGDYDNDDIPDLKVKFDRQALIEYLDGMVGEVTLTASGELGEDTPFEGSDTITVINPGKK